VSPALLIAKRSLENALSESVVQAKFNGVVVHVDIVGLVLGTTTTGTIDRLVERPIDRLSSVKLVLGFDLHRPMAVDHVLNPEAHHWSPVRVLGREYIRGG
jgi:hypothetical protein